MATQTFPATGTESYSAILRELAGSAKDLVRDELGLVKAELTQSARNVGRHSKQAAIFGGLLAISVLPFVAFLVIGLGEILNGMYWLSSLIVALVFAALGAPLAYRAFNKITEEDLQLPRTRETLQQEKRAVQKKMKNLQHATTGRTL